MYISIQFRTIFFDHQNPISQINMRDARVEEVEKLSDSEGEEATDDDNPKEDITIGIFPSHQGPTYLIMPNKQEKVNHQRSSAYT